MDGGATVRLTCRESGHGRPVVLLHGTGADAGTWDGPAWWDGLARITAPTLLLAGSHGSFPPETLRALADLIPTCRLDTLDGGHMLHHDQPAAVAAVAAFLDTPA
jgi:pimeloyl-ACP methyl ester carboxylesterase